MSIPNGRVVSRFYRPELDALRFFAFACVFGVHSHFGLRVFGAYTAAGNFGLCMFFFLSAFLIFSILLREHDESGTVDIQRFFIRRALRIWPLYFALLLATFLTRHLWMPQPMTGNALLALACMAGNFYIIHQGWILGPASVFWSISVEEQFYLGVPLLTRLAGRNGIAIVCIVVAIVSYVTLFVAGRTGAIPDLKLWPSSLVNFQFFAVGGLIALYFRQRPWKIGLLSRAALALLGTVSWTYAAVHAPLTSNTPLSSLKLVTGSLLVLLGTVSIFLATFEIKAKLPKVLLYLGKISFGLYLFHAYFLWLFSQDQPALIETLSQRYHLHYLEVPLALLSTIAAAALSYRFFERPILRFKERFETVRTRPA